MLDESTKNNVARLNKGELVMIHSAFRHPIKISFPKDAFQTVDVLEENHTLTINQTMEEE
jgi:hypothetical protein